TRGVDVLVLGGSRFNGLALVRELVRHGHDVTVLNRGQRRDVLPFGVRQLVGDRDDPASVRAALHGTGYDAVYDLSGYTLDQVRPVVEALRDRMGHFVFASTTVCHAATPILPIRADSPDEDGPRQNPYGLAKLEVERW